VFFFLSCLWPKTNKQTLQCEADATFSVSEKGDFNQVEPNGTGRIQIAFAFKVIPNKQPLIQTQNTSGFLQLTEFQILEYNNVSATWLVRPSSSPAIRAFEHLVLKKTNPILKTITKTFRLYLHPKIST
jgi:hypothetical protein